MIPYGRQSIDEDDIQAVVDVLRSDYLTTGPKVAEFESAVAQFVGAKHGVAVSSGTAALHCIMYAIDIKEGDEVIVPPITFCATANAVLYQRGTPIFADVEPDTLLIDPKEVEKKITSNTKAIVAVDYAGQPCNYDALLAIANQHKLILIADGCHAIGAEYKGKRVGTIADLTAFSFHPVKHITTGEGGMVMTNNTDWAERIRCFRNHGITTDHKQRAEKGQWFYEMRELGYNYRITDIQCALGISQLKKLENWISRRNAIAKEYDKAFAEINGITPLRQCLDRVNAFHLYVVQVDERYFGCSRDELFIRLRDQGIGVQVHYVPIHLHPFYRTNLNTQFGDCPIAEGRNGKPLSLPMFPAVTDKEVEHVVNSVQIKVG